MQGKFAVWFFNLKGLLITHKSKTEQNDESIGRKTMINKQKGVVIPLLRFNRAVAMCLNHWINGVSTNRLVANAP
jgi:hypothetical protein